MTGKEFLVWCAVLFIVVIAPALLVSYFRFKWPCSEDDEEGGYIRGFLWVIAGIFITYIVILVVNWDNSARIGYLIAIPIPITLVVAGHVVIVLMISKVISLFWGSKSPTICLSYYGMLFLCAGFLWADLYKGFDSNILNWIGGETFRNAVTDTKIDATMYASPDTSESATYSFQNDYDRAVAYYEKKYPKINPDSPMYDAQLVSHISNRMESYRESGWDEITSLHFSIDDFFGSSRSANSTVKSKTKPPSKTGKAEMYLQAEEKQKRSQKCIIKQIMSDDDYRACGITPPKNYR